MRTPLQPPHVRVPLHNLTWIQLVGAAAPECSILADPGDIHAAGVRFRADWATRVGEFTVVFWREGGGVDIVFSATCIALVGNGRVAAADKLWIFFGRGTGVKSVITGAGEMIRLGVPC